MSRFCYQLTTGRGELQIGFDRPRSQENHIVMGRHLDWRQNDRLFVVNLRYLGSRGKVGKASCSTGATITISQTFSTSEKLSYLPYVIPPMFSSESKSMATPAEISLL